MKYIIGLGNPGSKYEKTRHNVAWLLFDYLGLGNWDFDKYLNAEYSSLDELSSPMLFVKPQTFMNKSGEIIAKLKKQDSYEPENIIIVYDDLDLAFGKVKISFNRGDGGHNGIKSLTHHIGSKKTIRIRIGVSRVLEDGRVIKPNVLSNFEKKEISELQEKIAPKLFNILEMMGKSGLEKTMNYFNSK